jgi:hypothetical protein
MFTRMMKGIVERGEERLQKRSGEGLLHADRGRGELSGSRGKSRHSSFDFIRVSSESGRPQMEGDRSAFSVSPVSNIGSDIMRDQYRARVQEGETSRLRTSNSSRISEVDRPSSEANGSYHDTSSYSENDFYSARSRRERGSERFNNESVSDNSTITSRESESIFDHDEVGSNHGSETIYEGEPGSNEAQSNIAQHDSVNSDNPRGGVEDWLEGVYPTASDYNQHLWDGRNRLRKERERAEENSQELKNLFKKLFSKNLFGRDSDNQMSAIIVPLMAGELEQVESKMAPNPRE